MLPLSYVVAPEGKHFLVEGEHYFLACHEVEVLQVNECSSRTFYTGKIRMFTIEHRAVENVSTFSE